MSNYKKYLIIGLLLLVSAPIWALNFTAQHIHFKGLQRITPQTAMSYLPVKPGDKITHDQSDKIIHDLYNTGFFKNISLSRDKHTLVIHVKERPIISHLKITGNKAIPTKGLRQVLQKMNIVQSHEYNQAAVKKIKNALLGQYYAMGKFNAQVHVNVHHISPQQVKLVIHISEGQTATVQNIVIKGNQAYDDSTLIDHLDIDTNSWFDFVTHSSRFSSQKLSKGLQDLTQFYKDHGYKSFQIKNYNTSLTPDRKHVYINVTVHEGKQYQFGAYQFKGKQPYSQKRLEQLVTFEKGDVYSQSQLHDTVSAIKHLLGQKGYIHAQVKAHTHVNKHNRRVQVSFHIKPGKRIYVRHITFTDNDKTNDRAFRRTLHQYEGSVISAKALKESKRNLLQLPFVHNVSLQKESVQGHPNQVDLHYHIKTVPAGELKAGIGYSDTDGAMFNAGITQKNFLGTGNSFGVHGSYSETSLSANMHYFNPYYTPSGLGRGFSVYARRYNAGKANLTSFTTNSYGAKVHYSLPVNQYNTLNAYAGLDYLHLRTSSHPSDLVSDFIDKHGDQYLQVPVTLGWTRNTLDRSIFPEKGWYQSLSLTASLPVEKDSLQYYKGSYNTRYYHPIYHDFILKLRGDAGFGDGYGEFDRLPFLKNFYVGGMGSIRGYEANTIGPRDSENEAIGGNLFFDTSASLIVPNPISDNLRTSVFIDGGNVYDTDPTSEIDNHTQNRGRIRLSSGVEFHWLIPSLGMLNFSLAKAINATEQDNTRVFQFSVGTSL